MTAAGGDGAIGHTASGDRFQRSQIFGGDIAAMRSKRRAGRRKVSWRAVSAGIHLRVEVVKLVLTIERWRSIHHVMCQRLSRGHGGLVYKVIFVIDRERGRDVQ